MKREETQSIMVCDHFNINRYIDVDIYYVILLIIIGW